MLGPTISSVNIFNLQSENVISHMQYTHHRSIYISARRSFSLDWLRSYAIPFGSQLLCETTRTVLARFPFSRRPTYFKTEKETKPKNHQLCKVKTSMCHQLNSIPEKVDT
jgi:hypothetical protein